MSARRGRLPVAVLCLVCAGWLAVGLAGAVSYVRHYVRYRGFAPPRDPPGVGHGSVERVRFYSTALHAWKYYLIYRPPGYAAAAARGTRFPVLYLLHGGPSIPEDFVRVGAVAVNFDVELAARRVRPLLIVMPYGREHSGPPDTEWSNTRLGRYEDVVLDAVRAVDDRWPTLRGRAHRMLAGYSTGGYAAANITLHHLGTFATFESWSGFFVEDRSEAFKHEPEAKLLANSPADYVGSLRDLLRRHPVTGSAYQGLADHEHTAIGPFVRRAEAAGADVSDAFYPGRHDWRLWRYRMRYELRYASCVLFSPGSLGRTACRT